MEHITFISELTRKKRKLKSSWSRVELLQTNASNYQLFTNLQLYFILDIAEMIYDFLGCLCFQIDITNNLCQKIYSCHFNDCDLNGCDFCFDKIGHGGITCPKIPDDLIASLKRRRQP